MSLQSDLIAAIQGMSTAAGDRVHDEQVPQSVPLPFVAVTELSGTRPSDLNGVGLLRRSTMRLAIFARTAAERDTIVDVIKSDAPAGLQAFRGALGATTVSSIRVETASGEVALADGDNVIKGKGLDLFVVYY
jgi:hypothetical protein